MLIFFLYLCDSNVGTWQSSGNTKGEQNFSQKRSLIIIYKRIEN
jgi:hypothetical protein